MNNKTLSSSVELITENGIQINGLSNVVENQEIHYLDGPRQETSHPLGCDMNCLEFSMKYM